MAAYAHALRYTGRYERRALETLKETVCRRHTTGVETGVGGKVFGGFRVDVRQTLSSGELSEISSALCSPAPRDLTGARGASDGLTRVRRHFGRSLSSQQRDIT